MQVVRDGRSVEILVEELVVGDYVRIRGGDRVPADIRILTTRSCKVREYTVRMHT